MYHIFIHSSVDGHLGCLTNFLNSHFIFSVNKHVMNGYKISGIAIISKSLNETQVVYALIAPRAQRDREKQAKRPKRRGIGGSLVVWLDFRRQSCNPT